MLTKIPGNMVVRPDNTTWRTLHCGCKRHNSGTRLEQHFHATETPGDDRDDVSVWELAGLLLDKFRNRFVHCVEIQTNVAQILFDIPSNLPLCGGSQGAAKKAFNVCNFSQRAARPERLELTRAATCVVEREGWWAYGWTLVPDVMESVSNEFVNELSLILLCGRVCFTVVVDEVGGWNCMGRVCSSDETTTCI